MSSDTNSDIGNEEEDESDEEEPLFKFSSITIESELQNNNRTMSAEFSCIAVHEKFLAIGKLTGEILITDHLGHIISQYQIKAVII